MTTGDINEVFQMKTSAPSRFLRSDKEILEYIKFCVDEDSRVVLVDSGMYEYHYDHTDCIWFHPDEEEPSRCPSTCAQYRDGWNDAMQYIFRDGKGYRPYRRDEKYEDD